MTRRERFLLIVASVLSMAGFSVMATGCSVSQTRELVDRQIAVADEALDIKQRVDGVIAKVQAGVLTADEAVQRFAVFLPDEWFARFNTYRDTADSWLEAAFLLSNSLGDAFADAKAEQERIRALLNDRPDNADATAEMIQSIAVNFGIVGTAVAGVIGAWRTGRKKGRADLVQTLEDAKVRYHSETGGDLLDEDRAEAVRRAVTDAGLNATIKKLRSK